MKHRLSIKRGFHAGDRVRIKNYRRAIAWGKGKPQQFGFVTSVNGAYILVRPRWSPADRLLEFYPNEIAHAPRSRRRR
ncbi:MAG TPA: hypothetical protein V6D08_14460 [Candidatus Obscuribacterales bacterium]